MDTDSLNLSQSLSSKAMNHSLASLSAQRIWLRLAATRQWLAVSKPIHVRARYW